MEMQSFLILLNGELKKDFPDWISVSTYLVEIGTYIWDRMLHYTEYRTIKKSLTKLNYCGIKKKRTTNLHFVTPI